MYQTVRHLGVKSEVYCRIRTYHFRLKILDFRLGFYPVKCSFYCDLGDRILCLSHVDSLERDLGEAGDRGGDGAEDRHGSYGLHTHRRPLHHPLLLYRRPRQHRPHVPVFSGMVSTQSLCTSILWHDKYTEPMYQYSLAW